MESLEYYTSIPVNPYAEDEGIRDQEDVILAGEFQFKMDSIVETIGTNECKTNIDLFLKELYEEMELATLANFYNRCFTKLIDVYDMHTLDSYASNRHFEKEMKRQLTELLRFFEQDGWIRFFAKCLPADNPEIYLKGDLREYLNLNYKIISENIRTNKEHISKYVYYQLVMAARQDTVELLNKLITKNRNGLVTEMILNRGI
jgi:hypothetical protein